MTLLIDFKNIESLEDAEFVYNCYWRVGEEGSSAQPFSQLDDDEKQKYLETTQKINQIVTMATEKVGFVTMDEIPEGINLGGAVLPEYSDIGIGKTMLQKKAKILKDEGVAHVFVSCRKGNAEAQQTLEDAGFIFFAEEEKPPIGNQSSPMAYLIYKI